jgi:hypothetical protein
LGSQRGADALESAQEHAAARKHTRLRNSETTQRTRACTRMPTWCVRPVSGRQATRLRVPSVEVARRRKAVAATLEDGPVPTAVRRNCTHTQPLLSSGMLSCATRPLLRARCVRRAL